MTGTMRPYLLMTLLLAWNSVQALPAPVQLNQNGLGAHDWSATPDGTAFTVTTYREASGFLYRTEKSETQVLAPLEQQAQVAATKPFERVVLNPDGRYLLNFRDDKLVVREAASAAILWQGTLPNHPRPWSAQAFYFRSEDQRLQLLNGNKLLTFALASESVASAKVHADVAFDESGRRHYGNFVQAGAFSADGKSLFMGTMDGEVLQVDVSGDAPQLRRRIKVFEAYRAPGFSDDADGYVSRLQCVENCRRLVLGSFRGRQAAVVDVETGRVRGQMVDADRVVVHGIGDNWFVLARGVGKDAVTTLTDAEFRSPMPIPQLKTSSLAFGFNGGVATLTWSRDVRLVTTTTVAFTDVRALIPELSRRKLEAAETQARQQVAELKRIRALNDQQQDFRRKLRTGDDSHCGLVVERKGDIALVETQIGQKWLKVKQLYLAGSKNCVFVNGTLND